jgi:hypothetical protein
MGANSKSRGEGIERKESETKSKALPKVSQPAALPHPSVK